MIKKFRSWLVIKIKFLEQALYRIEQQNDKDDNHNWY